MTFCLTHFIIEEEGTELFSVSRIHVSFWAKRLYPFVSGLVLSCLGRVLSSVCILDFCSVPLLFAGGFPAGGIREAGRERRAGGWLAVLFRGGGDSDMGRGGEVAGLL